MKQQINAYDPWKDVTNQVTQLKNGCLRNLQKDLSK